MIINEAFIKDQIRRNLYEISLHADDERANDEITYDELEKVLSNPEILEQYPDDPRGESCLVLGFTNEGRPVHAVCGRNKDGNLFIVTVYVPTMPKWRDPRTRSR
ncbi:DUF4258 domain-containing protein [bacterium]|nr:DUF4258 domain-containing protein [bacterium]MCK4325778.1 DUF4258 domain-containing protein [bacterium]MCK4437079.1 DUF4258 domain-containing protein [bacterium]